MFLYNSVYLALMKVVTLLLASATKLRRLCFYRRLSVHRGEGVSASVHGGIHPPQEQTSPRSRPLRADHPWEQTPPPEQTHPPEQTPPGSRHPPRSRQPPGTDPPPRETAIAADGTHPTGMHSCYIFVAYLVQHMTAKLAHLLLSPFCCLWGENVITSQIVEVAEVHGSLPDLFPLLTWSGT